MEDDVKTYSLHEALKLVVENCWLQVNVKQDVLIPYLAGPPGMGKTRSLKELCKNQYWEIYPENLAAKPQEELGGIPYKEPFVYKNIEFQATLWSLPDILKDVFNASENIEKRHKELVSLGTIKKENSVVILFLDDIHLAGEDAEPLLFELLTERSIRKYKLPDNVAVVLAGNHGMNKAGARVMNAAIINRIQLMLVRSDFDHWKHIFAIPNYVHPGIISFLGNDQYRKFFHEEQLTDTPWASLRTWTGLSTHIRYKEMWNKGPVSPNDILYLTSGAVGREAATYFTEYYSIFSRFNIPEILNKGLDYQLPNEPINRYALAYAIISYFMGSKERKAIVSRVSAIIYLIGKHSPDLFLVMLNEIKSLNNKSYLFQDILVELKKIDPTIINTLLKEFGKFVI